MADSPTGPPTNPSPSTPTPDPAPAPVFRRPGASGVPPLRVLSPRRSTPIPSPTTAQTGGDGGGDGSPVDPVDTLTPSSGRHAVKVDKTGLAEIIQGAVYAASLWVHDLLARTDEARDAQVWVADGQDQAQIGQPLASIAARHGAPETATPDGADLIAAGIGALSYAVKHGKKALMLRLAARRQERRLARLAENTPTPQGETP